MRQNNSLTKSFIAGLIGGLVVLLVGVLVMLKTGYLKAPGENKDHQERIEMKMTSGKVKPQDNKAKNDTVESAVYERSKNAVVSVLNMTASQGSPFSHPLGQKGNKEASLQKASEGSGVIYKLVGKYAYVVTNNHVIQGADAVNVKLSDGTQKKAEVVGTDMWTDLAVLKIDAKGVDTVAEFANSDQIKVGQKAIAIGSPLGEAFSSSVTSGIVSGVNREVPMDLNRDGTPDFTNQVIQTDAAINPGNSGGALFNDAGQVVGINSMKIGSSQVEGMGFAIPSNQVVKIAKDLEENGKVLRPTLGVSMLNVSELPDIYREELRLPADLNTGVVIGQVEEGSNADKAGLKEYDVITRFDGKEIGTTIDLRHALYNAKVGSSVKLDIIREGKKRSIDLKLNNSLEGKVKKTLFPSNNR
ncbi:PDZ domain-containing protein [Atopobacter sp. AH10]|uniref:S1C family serine protease n=1 Tax=Atopobacter sp. AH10 TaxID=2315861 RepID=UPI000EF1E19B|nr:trypsin-like peptidase domain-containing protein [Atopobacter sp. AH10]RLK62591.1 PDZ domain-containing protein [Atopobacter sp. AH10]